MKIREIILGMIILGVIIISIATSMAINESRDNTIRSNIVNGSIIISIVLEDIKTGDSIKLTPHQPALLGFYATLPGYKATLLDLDKTLTKLLLEITLSAQWVRDMKLQVNGGLYGRREFKIKPFNGTKTILVEIKLGTLKSLMQKTGTRYVIKEGNRYRIKLDGEVLIIATGLPPFEREYTFKKGFNGEFHFKVIRVEPPKIIIREVKIKTQYRGVGGGTPGGFGYFFSLLGRAILSLYES